MSEAGAPERDERVAWIVGGTRGIGAAVVERLSDAGWTLIVSGHGRGALDRTEARRWTLPVDVRDGAAMADATARIAERWGGLDASVVSVREQGEGSFETLSDDAWHAALDTKLVGFVRVARNVLPLLAERSGSLVSIVGAAATIASADHPLGCINAALRHAIRGLALGWGPRGVRVLGLSPGPTRTDTLASMIEERARTRAVDAAVVEQEIAQATHRGRMLHPEEVAALVELLLDPRLAPVNGSVVQADDGSVGGCLG